MSTFRHVLVGVDFSTCADRALDCAGTIARCFDSDLTLLHVRPRELAGSDGESVAPEGAPVEDDPLRRRLSELAEPFGLLPARVHCVVGSGDPLHQILAYAATHPVDLVVVGTHGRRGLEHLVLGSVAEQLLRAARCSVLVAPRAPSTAWRCVEGPTTSEPGELLCAIDLADSSEDTLEIAARLASTMGARLMLLHAIEMWHWEDPWPPARGNEEACREELLTAARERLSRILSRHGDSAPVADVLIAFGRPRDEIVRVAKTRQPTLLVVGSHRIGLFDRVLFGSTAESILRAVPCPVLLARNPSGSV